MAGIDKIDERGDELFAKISGNPDGSPSDKGKTLSDIAQLDQLPDLSLHQTDLNPLSRPFSERIAGIERQFVDFPENAKADVVEFLGAIGVGKSTLVGRIAEAYSHRGVNVKRIEEMSREAVAIGLPINEKTTLLTQTWILLEHIKAVRKYSQHFGALVADRGEENFVFPEERFNGVLNLEALEALAVSWARTYPGKVTRFYVPRILKPVTADGTRSTNVDWIERIDNRIIAFLDRHKIAYYALPTPAQLSGIIPNVEEHPTVIYDFWQTLCADAIFPGKTSSWEQEGHIFIPKAVYGAGNSVGATGSLQR